MVVRVRHLWNQTTREVQFYLTSLDCDARKLGQGIRLHWSVENGLHSVISPNVSTGKKSKLASVSTDEFAK